MSNESGTVTVLDATVPKVRRCWRDSPARATRRGSPRPLRLRQRRPGRAGRRHRRAGRARGRPGRGGEGRAAHLDLARRHAASSHRSAPRRRGSRSSTSRARSARGSCARSPPTTSPTTSASRPTGSTSGSARASTGASRCTTRARCARCTPCPADAPPQHVTFDLLAKRVYVTSGDSGTLRTYRLADAKLLRTSRVTAGSYNVCALDGRVVTPSLDDGRLTLLDSRGLRSARRRAARPRRLHRRRCA